MQYGEAFRAMEQPALFAVLLSIGNRSELAVSSCCTLVGVQLLIRFVTVVQAVTLLSQGSTVSMAYVT